MNARHTLITGAILGFLTVAMGAFGAHALKSFLTQTGHLETYGLAIQYQFYHTVMLLVVGVLMHHVGSPKLRYAAACFLLGIVFFCGSLYVICFTELDAIGILTPVGGTLFLLGYIFLVAGVYKK